MKGSRVAEIILNILNKQQICGEGVKNNPSAKIHLHPISALCRYLLCFLCLPVIHALSATT